MNVGLARFDFIKVRLCHSALITSGLQRCRDFSLWGQLVNIHQTTAICQFESPDLRTLPNLAAGGKTLDFSFAELQNSRSMTLLLSSNLRSTLGHRSEFSTRVNNIAQTNLISKGNRYFDLI